MSQNDKIITIQLLDKQLTIKCPPEKCEDLRKATYLLESKMREVKEKGSAIGHEKIAQMAGLMLAYELMVTRKQKDLYLDTIGTRIQDLQLKIENALNED
jgi:cell division protein ZapA